MCYVFSRSGVPGTTAVIDDQEGDGTNSVVKDGGSYIGKPYSGIMGWAYADRTTDGTNKPTDNPDVEAIYQMYQSSIGDLMWSRSPKDETGFGHKTLRVEFWAPTRAVSVRVD